MDNLKSFDQANFVGALALYQHRRDLALGLSHVTTKPRGLLWYYNDLQRKSYEAYQALMLKSFHLGVVRGARKRMRQIRRSVKADTPIEQARVLYQEYMLLQESFNKSIEVINA